jgi:hypothetical protein
MAETKAYILCRFALESRLYQSWLPQLPFPYEIVDEFPGNWQPPDDCGVIISHMHYRWDEVTALRRIYESRQIPILILADGILEYRNIFEHPDLANGAVFQPIIGHKLACIGRGQARIIESWGNVGKCEVVGFPRLDSLVNSVAAPINKAGPFRLLICSANTPAFTEVQRLSVLESLAHIKSRFEGNPLVNGRPTEVTWRLTDGLDEELGFSPSPLREELPSLLETIDNSDAVITTPSTIFLESVLKGRPTAILDFHNTPHFVPAAWMINAPKHLNTILGELANPPTAKMLFQNYVLHDQLECSSAATPRLLKLISELVAIGDEARRTKSKLEFPPRILADSNHGFARVEAGFSMADLFPDNSVLKNNDVGQLQLELNLAIQRMGEVPDQLFRLLQQLEERNERLDELQQRYNDTKARLDAAKERLKKWRNSAAAGKGTPPVEDGGDDEI